MGEQNDQRDQARQMEVNRQNPTLYQVLPSLTAFHVIFHA